MSTAILFTCVQCKSVFEVKPEWIGRKAKCPQCGLVSRITARGADGPREEIPTTRNDRPHDTLHDIDPRARVLWEYRVLRHDFESNGEVAEHLNQAMNTEGTEGWECVSVLPPPVALVIYKRVKRA
jgi:hypothetical protein